jgi:hypothetical protein
MNGRRRAHHQAENENQMWPVFGENTLERGQFQCHDNLSVKVMPETHGL